MYGKKQDQENVLEFNNFNVFPEKIRFRKREPWRGRPRPRLFPAVAFAFSSQLVARSYSLRTQGP